MRARPLLALALCLVCGACVSTRMSDTQGDRLYRDGQFADAAEYLRGRYEKEKGSNDELLYVLDTALSYHSAGQYAESTKWFLLADQMAEIKDYTNLAAEAGTLLTSDNIKHYKAEDFEYVLITTYLAMNFALQGNVEDALVEARRVNRKLHLMVTEGKRKYKQSAFARYLSAILYEMQGEWSDAYLDYKHAWELNPALPGIGFDLYRMALADRREEAARWKREFNLDDAMVAEAKKRAGKKGKQGEIIVLYENGISPRKHPHPNWHSIPIFQARPNPVTYADVKVNGDVRGRTGVLEDIEAVAIQNLDDKAAEIIAKKVAGAVAKEAIGNEVARQSKSEGLGALVKLLFWVSDQADVRSWNLLPKDLQIARVWVDPGEYDISLALPEAGRELPGQKIKVEAGRKVFVNFRFMP